MQPCCVGDIISVLIPYCQQTKLHLSVSFCAKLLPINLDKLRSTEMVLVHSQTTSVFFTPRSANLHSRCNKTFEITCLCLLEKMPTKSRKKSMYTKINDCPIILEKQYKENHPRPMCKMYLQQMC